MLNKLLGTNFTKITNVLYNQRFLDTRYNIDIVSHGIIDRITKKFGLELNGVFYHRFKELRQTYKYYKVMKERKRQHQTKDLRLKDRMNEGAFEDIFHVTDVEFIKFEQDNDIKIEMPPQYNISNRSILAGVRTECYTHCREIDRPNEKLYGIGFTSLYPSGMVFGNLPLRDLIVGTQAESSTYTKNIDSKDIAKHKFKLDQAYIDNLIEYVRSIPRKITAEQRLQYYLAGCDKKQRVIQIKCQMLPPRDLKFPVLGCHICNKLIFPLCRTCAEQQCLNVNNHYKCKHNLEQRYLYGFWHEIELINALYEGYTFRDRCKIHTYQITSFNDKKYDGNNYINSQMFNKTLHSDQDGYKDETVLKQLANDCKFDYKYDNGIAYIKQKGQQDYRSIKLNPGGKSFYKLLLNAIYSKTGQNVVRPTTQFHQGEFIFEQWDKELHNNCTVQLVGKNIFKNTFNYEEQLQQTQRSQSNVSFAGAIISVQRTLLYTLMRYINDELKELVLYGDTDSIYCILDRGMYPNLISVTFKNTYSCQYEQKLEPELWVCLGEQVYAYTDGIRCAHTSKGITVDKQGIMTLEDQSQKHLFEVYIHVLFDKINIDKNSNAQYPTIRRYKQKQSKKQTSQEIRRIVAYIQTQHINRSKWTHRNDVLILIQHRMKQLHYHLDMQKND
uniref:DNA-directed DNA polymerase n=1 Tax=Spironucleus salmonicida TaxID=348837 RepID=V6LEG1_9EUKA|eukprot:EST42872.1 hypothetical protein SS50377_17494 [Spironucleus salmonicida]